jgi:hypothetical protein
VLKGAQAGVVPALLDTLVDKTWLFKVESKANHNQRFEQSFRVRKICTDADIIQQFQEKWDSEEAAVVKSINVRYNLFISSHFSFNVTLFIT